MKRLSAALLLLLAGCSALGPPISSEGIARVVREAAPALRELAQSAAPQGPPGEQAEPPSLVLYVILPNVARGIWPFSGNHIGSETIVIIGPRVAGHKLPGPAAGPTTQTEGGVR